MRHRLHIEVFDQHGGTARDLFVCRACGAAVWAETPAGVGRNTTFIWLQAAHEANPSISRPFWTLTLRSSSLTWSTVSLPTFPTRWPG